MANNLNSLTICKAVAFPRKKIKHTGLFKVLFLLLFIVGTNNLANAQIFKVGDLYYEITSTSPNEVAVVHQKGNHPYWDDNEKPIGDQIIPENVKYENKPYTVTAIGEEAFYECSGLTSVIIPNSIKKIRYYAFNGCTGLTSLTIPNSVTKIYDNILSGCISLTEINVALNNSNYSSLDGVLFNKEKTLLILYPINKPDTAYTIPNSVTTTDWRAFTDCKNLLNLTIPNSITTINNFTFWSSNSLTAINVEPNNPNYSSLDGVLFNKEKTLLKVYPINKPDTTYTIPNSATIIHEYAFAGCKNLINVTIPNSITTIGYNAFGDCINLTSITIPNSVTKISDFAFDACTGLTSVTIPNSVIEIGSRTFRGCTNLTTIISKIENISAVEMDYKVFENVNKETCTLYVPEGKVDEYKAAEQWQDFINIEENTTIGVEITKANNISIYPTCVQTGFTVEGSEPHKNLEIFTITRKKVLSTVITSNSQYIDINNLQSGVYLVKIGNKTTKIIKM